ncbi:NTP transferase domain-containing protein [Calditrichota bacterium]
MSAITAIVLAAGEGKRMGFPKALLPIEGGYLIEHLARRLCLLKCNEIVCVVNSEIKHKLPEKFGSEAKVLVNMELEKGQLYSIQLGLDAIESRPKAILLLPVDFPFISNSTLETLIDRANPDKILIPTFYDETSMQMRRGHPPAWGSNLKQLLFKASLDLGARDIYRKHLELIEELQTEDSGVLFNVNNPQDWEKGLRQYYE